VSVFDDLFGRPEADPRVAEGLLRRVARRADRIAKSGIEPTGLHRDQGRAELARQIAEALQARDVVRAQALIREGAAVFGHSALLASVEAVARQERTEAMGAVDSYHSEVDPWSEDREPYGLEDGGLDDGAR
jgi:hypothetical protein